MGCDIHMVVEVKHGSRYIGLHAFPSPSGAVVLDKSIQIAGETEPRTYLHVLGYVSYSIDCRNYAMFAKLAGVRGDGPQAKGVPKNVSALARMEIDAWGSDGHSHSYDSAKRFLEIAAETEQIPDVVRTVVEEGQGAEFTLEEAASKWLGVSCDQYGGIQNVRVVYWFDN